MSSADEQGLAFGRRASSYDRFRPGYPTELFDELLGLTARHRVLEAGAGTGIATRELARRGAVVHAVEPDPAMAALARRNTVGLAVRVQESSFERCAPRRAGFDVVVSFQAWHWVERVAGSRVAAHALAGDGHLAVVWNRPRDLEGPVWEAVHAVYEREAPQLERRARLAGQDEREASFAPADGFGPWTRRTFDWSVRYDAESYRGVISTYSDHQRLPSAVRERVLDGVAGAIEATGGVLDHHYRAVLVHAPRQVGR